MIGKISVIMPVYNTWRYLKDSISSVLNQTFRDFEFIIVDDGSKDWSFKIIEDFAKTDNRIIALRNENNMWIWFTRNRWLGKANWDWIVNFDSDDIAESNWLEKQIEFITKNPNVDIVWANITFMDSDWNILFKKTKFPNNDKDIRKSMPLVCSIANNTVFIKRSCFDEMWKYEDWARTTEDYFLWIKFSKKFKFANNDEYLVRYRVHWENSIIREQKKIIWDTLRDLRKKIKMVFPANFTVISFMIRSVFSYWVLFILLAIKKRKIW